MLSRFFRQQRSDEDPFIFIAKSVQVYADEFKGAPRGATNAEITELEASVGGWLPTAYKEYLRWMGKDGAPDGGLLSGSDWYIDDAFHNMEVLEELLKLHEKPPISPTDHLCFLSHHGYMAAYFSLKEKDENPIVFSARETEHGLQLNQSRRFSEFLFIEISNHIQILKKFS